MSTFLRYGYQVPPDFALYPMLGSTVRALGKGWDVLVRGNKSELRSYQDLAQQLKKPGQLHFSPMLEIENHSKLIQPAIPQNFSPELQLWHSASVEKEALNVSGKDGSSPNAFHLMVAGKNVSEVDFDLISNFVITRSNPQGVTAIVGSGKGKTTSALGIAAEAVARGKSVAVVQWFKEKHGEGDKRWKINEHDFPALLNIPDQFVISPMGLGFFGSPKYDRVAGATAYQLHRDKAYQGLALATEYLQQAHVDVLVLDEFVDTVAEIAGNIEYPLLDLVDVQDFLKKAAKQTKVAVVVTGRKVTSDWAPMVAQAITIDSVKHPWNTNRQGAISGLDF